MKKILIPIDGSEYSERALDKAKEIAKVYNSELTLLNVVDDLISSLSLIESELLIAQMKNKSNKLLNLQKESLENEFDVTIITKEGDPAKIIVDHAEKNGIDLIIMGSHGLGAGRVREFFLGSITHKVLNMTKIPILVIK